MSIKAQMARSTANITGVTGETPSGGGKPGPASGPNMPNQKASSLNKVASQSLDATRKDVSKLVSGPTNSGNKVDQKWKGAPSSVMHTKAPPTPGP